MAKSNRKSAPVVAQVPAVAPVAPVAPAAPAAAVDAPAAAPVALYVLGATKASPRVDHNKAAWAQVLAALQANPAGCSKDQIVAALTGMPKITPHVMLAYLLDSKWLQVVAAPAKAE